jgi:hypothetical protein
MKIGDELVDAIYRIDNGRRELPRVAFEFCFKLFKEAIALVFGGR